MKKVEQYFLGVRVRRSFPVCVDPSSCKNSPTGHSAVVFKSLNVLRYQPHARNTGLNACVRKVSHQISQCSPHRLTSDNTFRLNDIFGYKEVSS